MAMSIEDEEEKRLETFLQWAVEIGVSDSPIPTAPLPQCSSSHSASTCLGHSLILSYFPDAGGRGLAAAREIKRGEMVLRVPRNALLTRENVLRDEKLASCFAKHSQLTPTQVLTVCLLAEVEKGKCSWWYPYLTQLPRSYNTLAHFTHFEIQSFQINDAIWVSEKAVHEALWDWKQAMSLTKEIELRTQLQTFKSWLWASATVSSRALHLPWDCAGCLCPVGDFFNYAAPGDVAENSVDSPFWEHRDEEENTEKLEESSRRLTDGGYEKDINSYCFYARKRYRKGEQVLLCYGTYTNLELLEHYGFLLDVNPNDKYFIQIETDMQISDSWPKESLYIQQDGKPSFALMSALRLGATPKNLRRAVGHLAYSGMQLSAENERSVMQFLSTKCEHILNELPSSAEDDGVLLDVINQMLKQFSSEANSVLSRWGKELKEFCQVNGLDSGGVVSSLPVKVKRSMERWRLAVQWRLIYKKVLLRCISYCNEVISNL